MAASLAITIAAAGQAVDQVSPNLGIMWRKSPWDRKRVAEVIHALAKAQVGEAIADNLTMLLRCVIDRETKANTRAAQRQR